MTENEELAYLRGQRSVHVQQLRNALHQLGYDSEEAKENAWILEREATVATLREACKTHGDNDWKDNLHLADVIEKHLMRHIPEP